MKQCTDCTKQKKADNCIECAVEAKKKLKSVKKELQKLKAVIESNDMTGRIIKATEKLQEALNGN